VVPSFFWHDRGYHHACLRHLFPVPFIFMLLQWRKLVLLLQMSVWPLCLVAGFRPLQLCW